MKIKTLDISAREWFDKVNGNSYFSAHVSINFGLKGQKDFAIEYQYGYGDHYLTIAFQELQKRGYIKAQDSNIALWRYCSEHNIILRKTKYENCLKRDMISFGANI